MEAVLEVGVLGRCTCKPNWWLTPCPYHLRTDRRHSEVIMELHVINQPNDDLLKEHARWVVESDLALAQSEFQWLVKDKLEVGLEEWLKDLSDFTKQEKSLLDSIGFDEEADAGTWILLAISNGEPVGMARTVVWGDGIWSVNSVFVDPSHRNKGVGYALMDKVKRTAQEFDGKQIQLSVYNRNAAAMKLYQKLGFISYTTNMACSL